MPYRFNAFTGELDFYQAGTSLPGTTNGDLIYYDGSAYQRLAAGSSGYALKANGAASVPAYDRPFRDPSRFLYIHEDWVSAGSAGATGWTAFPAGTGATTSVDQTNADSKHQGVLGLSFGTTATGRCSLALGAPNLPNMLMPTWAKFEALLLIQWLSVSTDEYALRVGFGDSTAVDFTNGMYIEYSRPSSVNWVLKTSKAGVRTSVDSGIAVVNNSWIKLAAIHNNGVVTGYINGTAIGTTITTNIPGASQPFVPIVQYQKSTGTSAELLSIDYFDIQMEFGTAR